MNRISILLIAVVAIPVFAFPALVAYSQNESLSDSPKSLNDKSETEQPQPVYDKRGDERLYRRVLSKLRDMQFAKDSGFLDEEPNDKIDWFIVGGSFLDNRSGELQANFATMQGADSVARKIVEFESADFGKGVTASWKVFDRYGGSGEASNALQKLETEFKAYQKDRIASLRRQQQLAASRARSRSRRGSC